APSYQTSPRWSSLLDDIPAETAPGPPGQNLPCGSPCRRCARQATVVVVRWMVVRSRYLKYSSHVAVGHVLPILRQHEEGPPGGGIAGFGLHHGLVVATVRLVVSVPARELPGGFD